MSIALVAVSIVFLVVGFAVLDGLASIYLSIVCSVAAGLVLYAAVRQRSTDANGELVAHAERGVDGPPVG